MTLSWRYNAWGTGTNGKRWKVEYADLFVCLSAKWTKVCVSIFHPRADALTTFSCCFIKWLGKGSRTFTTLSWFTQTNTKFTGSASIQPKKAIPYYFDFNRLTACLDQDKLVFTCFFDRLYQHFNQLEKLTFGLVNRFLKQS